METSSSASDSDANVSHNLSIRLAVQYVKTSLPLERRGTGPQRSLDVVVSANCPSSDLVPIRIIRSRSRRRGSVSVYLLPVGGACELRVRDLADSFFAMNE